MADNVLDSYLIALGFKVDPASRQRFVDTVDSAMKAAVGLAAAWTAAATAIAVTVTKVASSLDSMYFTAQRANTSVANLKAYEYALSQLGVAGSAAGSTIEAIAKAIRTNPGNEGLLNAIGVQTRNAKGELRDTVDIMVDLDGRLSKMPQYVATQYAAVLGIDENTFNAMRGRWAGIQKDMDDYRRKAAEMGVNPDKAAAEANELMTQVRSFQAQVDLLVLKIAQDLGPTLEAYLKQFSQWITDHRDEIVQFVDRLVKALVEVAGDLADIAQKAEPVVDQFVKMSEALTGEKGLKAALEVVLAFMVGTWAVKMIAASAQVAASFGWLGPIVALIAGGSAAVNWETDQPMRSPVTGGWNRGYSGPGMVNPEGEAPRGRIEWGDVWTWTKRKLGFGGSDNNAAVDKASLARNTALPPEARALLDTIGGSEAPGYNVTYGGGRFSDYSDHPRQANVITSGPNAGQTSTAAGRYQFLASTWDPIAKRLKLPSFSPENQDVAAWDLAQKAYFERTGRDLLADLKSGDPNKIAAAGVALNRIWTSLPGGIEQGQDIQKMLDRYAASLAAEQARNDNPAPAAPPKTTPAMPIKIAPKLAAPTPTLTAFANPFASGLSSPLLAGGAAGAGASVHQTNSIVVNGATDPHATANEIERRQRGLNGALLDTLKGAVQ